MPHGVEEIARIFWGKGRQGLPDIRQIGGPRRGNSIIWHSNNPVDCRAAPQGSSDAGSPVLDRGSAGKTIPTGAGKTSFPTGKWIATPGRG